MKILFLCHPESDYGESFIFSGLCELLGENSIVLYPPKLTYLGITDKYYLLYGEGKRGATCPPSYLKPRNMRIYAFEEIADTMGEFDLIVLASPRHYAVNALRFIKRLFGNKIPKPLAFIDSEDSEGLRVDLIQEFEPQFIFKRELLSEVPNVHPLPFSSSVPYLPYYDELLNKEKTLDVFALFGNTHRLRSDIVKFLLEQQYANSYIGIDTGALPWQNENRFKIPPLKGYREYLESMASAKINIVIRGHGRDTVRYWEVASFKTLMLVKDPGIIIPHPYEDKKHCVYFEDSSDLKEKIDYYLVHNEEREKIANACFQHTIDYHTNLRHAEYFLDIVKLKL